eukprot:8620651-Alexandrium_andersonii.AAC.1
MQTADLLRPHRLWLDLGWVPRERSVLADQPRSENCEGFDPGLRIDLDWGPVLKVTRYPVLA